MPTLRVKRFAVRDAATMERIGSKRSWIAADLAQREADKLSKRGKAAIVVPLED